MTICGRHNNTNYFESKFYFDFIWYLNPVLIEQTFRIEIHISLLEEKPCMNTKVGVSVLGIPRSA